MDIVVKGYKCTDIVVPMLTYSTKARIVKLFTINCENLLGWVGPTQTPILQNRVCASYAQPAHM